MATDTVTIEMENKIPGGSSANKKILLGHKINATGPMGISIPKYSLIKRNVSRKIGTRSPAIGQ